MRFLIVKKGALGDVIRTSYFARAIKEQRKGETKITWLTAPISLPLLQYNPWIDRVVTSFSECETETYDRIYSLDDERETLLGVKSLWNPSISGAYLDSERPAYTEDAVEWFDMGLLSRFGKARADELKRVNEKGHAEIFSRIFDVRRVEPRFYGDPREEEWARQWLDEDYFHIAINPFAGGRWPSKELREVELEKLISRLLEWQPPDGRPVRTILLGAGSDRNRNNSLAAQFSPERVWVADTDSSVLRLAGVIRIAKALISSDSLALHLAISQRVPFVSFFAPTSAAEIDDFGLGIKITSTSADYCSYKRDADNSSLTADRLMQAFTGLTERWSQTGVKQFEPVGETQP
jgi:heptosyltransferase II